MVNLTEEIRPLTDFKRNTADFVKLMAKTKRQVVLTDAEEFIQFIRQVKRQPNG